jgi:hypothetical protein
MSADWSDLAPFKVEGHPPLYINRGAMADPESAQPYVFEDKLYWIEGKGPWDTGGMTFGPYHIQVLQSSGASNILGAHTLVNRLGEAAKTLVDLLEDAETNHGGLIGTKTLTAKNVLRMELSRWK